MANLKIEGSNKRAPIKENEAARKRRARKEGLQGRSDLSLCTSSLLHAAICAVASTGGAVRLCYTADGGAITIAIYTDGDVEKIYVKPNESLDEVFIEILEDYGHADPSTYDGRGSRDA